MRAVVVGGGVVAVLAALATYFSWPADVSIPEAYEQISEAARIHPAYSGVTIPPNIAPLNFVVLEKGSDYRVRVHSAAAADIVVAGDGARIVIPPQKWRECLEANRGGQVHFDIFLFADGGWRRYPTISNRIATEPIDPVLVYRKLGSLRNVYRFMGTYQRDLESFDESPILISRGGKRCVNCHTFANNRPDPMILHMRGEDGVAMLLARGARVEKIDTRTRFNPSPAAYTAWHPSGKTAAFSVNSLILLYHTQCLECRDVFDYASDIGLYGLSLNEVFSTRKIAHPDHLETYPSWSPDGKHLYFCSAARNWPLDAQSRQLIPRDYLRVRYDLMRISYNVETRVWGSPERVLEAPPDKSITQPRISPDGRFVVFCMARYGNFPVYAQDSDLYILDLRSGKHRKLAANSDRTESWHSWSSNGRWLVFSSKRGDGVFARPYFCYVDDKGTSDTPFLLPQADPTYYDSLLQTFNVPELVTGRVAVDEKQLVEATRSSKTGRGVSAVSGATPRTEPAEQPAVSPRRAAPKDGFLLPPGSDYPG